MKALISTLEIRESGYRVAQVTSDNGVFPVAHELFWVDCEDNIEADHFWYDPADHTIKPLRPQPAPDQQPTVKGAQAL